MSINEFLYTVRLKTFTEGELIIYTINLPAEIPLGGHSWGDIKSIYRK